MNVLWWFVLAIFVIDAWAEVVVKEEAKDSFVNGKRRNRNDSHPSLPDYVVIQMTICNENVTLNLTKDTKEDYEEIPIFIGGKWKTEKWNHSSEEDFNVYSDESKTASFTLVINTHCGTKFIEYFGFFVYKKIKYSLIPKALHEKSPNQSEVVHILSLHGIDYVVYQDTDELQQPRTVVNKNNDSVVPEISKSNKSKRTRKLKKSEKQRKPPGKRSRRVKRDYNKNLIVDLLIIIDNSVYSKWLYLNNNTKNHAIEQIRYYLAHVFNGVNNVYSTMKMYTLSVSVISIFICETKNQCMFTEESNVYTGVQGRISFQNALDNFRHWVKDKRSHGKVANHDVAVAFTDYNESPTEGVAYLSSACNDYAQGVIHEKGHYDTITIAAHEIGHLLGCEHDSGNCPPKYHYLMSPIISNEKLQNRDKLSTCSINYILKQVNKLELQRNNCLDSNKRSTRKDEDLKRHLGGMHPGKHFGPDQQCKLKFGREYKYCSEGKDSHLKICNRMRCAKDDKCYSGHPLALNGTFCGNNKWCMSGGCVSGNPDRKVDRDDCFFGDKSESFNYNSNHMTCKDVVRDPKSCYVLSEFCCETCSKIKAKKNITIKGCEYGEKGMQIRILSGAVRDCSYAFEQPTVCFQQSIAEYCCETCMKVKSLITTRSPARTTKRPRITYRPYSRPSKMPYHYVSTKTYRPFLHTISYKYHNYNG